MSYRNRCIISGSNGLINLTVPLKKGREQKAMIRDIAIDNGQPWQNQHWGAIQSSYSRAPFFEYFSGDIRSLIFKPQRYLFDLNLDIIEYVNKILKLNVSIELTSEFKKVYEGGDVLDVRNHWLPKNRVHDNNWQPVYTQVFEDKFGFIPNLSVLDLIFCKGGL